MERLGRLRDDLEIANAFVHIWKVTMEVLVESMNWDVGGAVSIVVLEADEAEEVLAHASVFFSFSVRLELR